ncbi:flagellar basal body-associated FliL family protein [Mesorhizobium sp. C268A]|uniref:flagellar basal body-associated FliL family protein n=1 Tax=Mesorhizobium sp. C268A TaxID=2956826 RepID=UPI0033382271
MSNRFSKKGPVACHPACDAAGGDGRRDRHGLDVRRLSEGRRGTGACAAAPENQSNAEQPSKAAEHAPGTGPTLVQLAPITTNLASPADTWIRLEASVVYDAPQPPELTESIHQDLLAMVRTLKMHQIEGASGYQHLKADLEERAAIRSGGHAKQVLIRTLLLE